MAAMQPAAQLQLPNFASPSGLCLLQPQPTPANHEKACKPSPQSLHDSCPSKAPSASSLGHVPRLRAVVESQAFKNILVDEMDMMVSRAATVIQANWKGYRLRQKLISQMTAAKAIQEAWRRFSTRRLMRSNRLTLRKAKREEEGDIPYHAPQQVRFHAPGDQPPVMVSKETQFPSSDNLVSSRATAAPAPCASGIPRSGLQQPVASRHTGPKHQPGMLTKTARSSCLVRHLEGDGGKSKHVAAKTTKGGSPESAAAGRHGQATHGSLKTHAHTEADVPKATPHTSQVNKTRVCPAAAATPKSPSSMPMAPKCAPQTRPTSSVTVTKMQSPTCPTSSVARPLAHVRPNSSISSTTPQTRCTVPMARTQHPGAAATSTLKASPHSVAPVSKAPPHTGPRLPGTKTSPQMRSVNRSQPQACAVPTSSKPSSQTSPLLKSPPHTRLAAMITRTPAQIRSVAAVLRTLCLVPTAAASSPKQTPVASIPNTTSQVQMNSPKAKVTISTRQTTAVVKVASQSCLAEGKGRCGHHGHLEHVASKPARSPLDVEKMKPVPPKPPRKEVAPKTHTAVVSRVLSWTKVTEDRNKPLVQIQQKAEIVRVQSRVYMPEEMTVTLSQAQLAVPLTKFSRAQPPPGHARPPPAPPLCNAVSQSCMSSGLATGPPEGHHPPVGPSATLSSPLAAHLMSLTTQLQPAGEQARSVSRAHLASPYPATASPQAHSPRMTLVPPEGYLHTCPSTSAPQHFTTSCPVKPSPQLHPPAEHAKTTDSKTTKAECHVCPPTKLSKAPSLAQLITCLAKVPSQAHLPMGLTRAQSQAQLATEAAKCLLAAHTATDLSSKTPLQPLLSNSKAPVQFWQHIGTLSTGPCAKPDDRNVAQPQLHGHTQNKATQNPCSVAMDTQSMLVSLMTPTGHPADWGDSGRARTPPPPHPPTQAVSGHDDLAASIASLCADLVAMLGSPEDLRALLAKTFSQGEIRTVLSQALSREILGPSVVKALPQGMLGMALMKALSWGELGISLSRALSRSELRPEHSKTTQGKLAEALCKALTEDERATLSQALCQGELGAVFSQSLAQMAQRTGAFLPKATSKTVGSRMTTAPAPVEMTCSGSVSVAWGRMPGPVRARCSKVRPPWGGLSWGQPSGVLLGKRGGATSEGAPCLPQSPTDAFSRGFISTYGCPLPSLSQEGSVLSSLYLRLLDFDSMACGEGPYVPRRPFQQPLPGPWQPLVANGVGPSSNQSPVTSSPAPSSHQAPVASRVSYSGVAYREGVVVASKHSGDMGGGKSPMSQQPFTICQGNVCQCPNLGTHRMSPCGRSPLPKETLRQILLSGHRLVSMPSGDKEGVTAVKTSVDGQRGSRSSLFVNPKSQKVSSMSTPRPDRHLQASLTPPRSRSQATGRHVSLLDELLATFPQHPQIVLAKSYQGGSAGHCQSSSDSQSSLSTHSATSSTSSSLMLSEVLEGCGEGSLLASWPVSKEPKEGRHRPQGQLDKTWPAALQHTDFQPLEPGSPHFHSTSLTLNVHWDSDSESDYSTEDVPEGLSQDRTAAQHRRSQVRARNLDPSTLEAPEASKGSPCLSQPLEAVGLCPSASQHAGVSPVFPSLALPSVATRAFPMLAHPPMENRTSPSLTEPLMCCGSPTKFRQPFLYYGGPPTHIQQHRAFTVPSNFTQTPPTTVSTQEWSTGAASSPVHPSAASWGGTQVPVGSWPPPGPSFVPAQCSVHPDSVQTSVGIGVSPNCFHPCMSCSALSRFTQPCMATVVTSNYVQPPMPHSMSPSLAHPIVLSVRSPAPAHTSVANRASPSLDQPTAASSVVPGALQVPLSSSAPPSLSLPFPAPRECSNLPSASVAALGTMSLVPPTVVCGVGRGISKPALGPWQHTQAHSCRAQSQAPPLSLGGLYPCVMGTSGQPGLGVCCSPGDNLLIDAGSRSSPQDSTIHSEPTQASKGPSSPVAQPMPGSCQSSVASEEASGLALEASAPCQAWFRGIAPGAPQGPVATGLFLSMCQGANPPPVTAWALPADVHWTQGKAAMATSVGQGPCLAAMPSIQLPSEFFSSQLGTSIPQTCAPIPVTLDPQLLSVAAMVQPSCRYAGMIIPDAPVAAVAGGLAQSSDRKVPLALAPKPVVESETLTLPQGSVIRGVGKSVSLESTGAVVTQDLPPESVIRGEAQHPCRDPVAGDVALSLLPGFMASGEALSYPQETDKEKLSPAVESSPSSHSPGPGPSSVTGAPSTPLRSVAGSATPGSMLVGLSPRPYQAQSWEGSRVPFLAFHVTSLDVSPAEQKVAQGPQHLPTVLSSAPQADSGLTKLVGVDKVTPLKLGQIDGTVPSIDSVKPEGVEVIPWKGLGATGGENPGCEPLSAEHVLKDQIISKAQLGEEVPSQASSVTPAPEQAPSLGEHPTAKSVTPVQPSSSEGDSGPHSLHPAPAPPTLQEALVDDTSSQPLASSASVAPQLSAGSAGTTQLPLGLEARPGNPGSLQSSEETDSASPPKNRASGVSQMGEPQNYSKSKHQEPLVAKKPSRSTQGSLVSELLEGSMNRLLPPGCPQKQSSGTRVPSGVQKVCVGYAPSNGSLLDEAAQGPRHADQPKPVLPSPPSGQRTSFVTSPGVRCDGSSPVSATPHGHKVENVTSPAPGYDGGSRVPTTPHGHKQRDTQSKANFDEGSQRVPAIRYGHRLQQITAPERSPDGSSQVPQTAPHSQKRCVADLRTIFDRAPQVPPTSHGYRPYPPTQSKTGHKITPPPTVPQGPVDAGLASSQSWNSKVPSVSVRATARAGAPRGTWPPSGGHRPWDLSGTEAALDRKPSAELLVSVRAMEKVVVQAVVTIQACTRGYLVRRTLKVWHQWATTIQASWRGYRVRRNLARLVRATTIIQAAWRGHCTRRARAHQLLLLPTAWPELRGRTQAGVDTRNSSEHRCFLSCQPDVCSVCQSLGPQLESPPSVVMLVGSQPRTCHVCGHTLSTRVVQGFGQGVSVQPGAQWASVPQQSLQLSQQHRAASLIQASWKGYRTRCRLRQQQSAAKMVQATWRGHYTRSCLTTDALLGTGSPWNSSRSSTSHRTSRAYSLHWPGV